MKLRKFLIFFILIFLSNSRTFANLSYKCCESGNDCDKSFNTINRPVIDPPTGNLHASLSEICWFAIKKRNKSAKPAYKTSNGQVITIKREDFKKVLIKKADGENGFTMPTKENLPPDLSKKERHEALSDGMAYYQHFVKDCLRKPNEELNEAEKLWLSVGRPLATFIENKSIEEIQAATKLPLAQRRDQFCKALKSQYDRAFLGCQLGHCGEGANYGYCLAHAAQMKNILKCVSDNDHVFAIYLDPDLETICVMDRWNLTGDGGHFCGVTFQNGTLHKRGVPSEKRWYQDIKCSDPLAVNSVQISQNNRKFTAETWKAESKELKEPAKKASLTELMGKVGEKKATQDKIDDALSLAIKLKKYDTVHTVLKNSANPNRSDEAGNTPLIRAARVSDKDILELLLENKAAVNSQNRQGWSALHFAAFNCKQKEIELLISHGADRSLKSKDGRTPADIADEACEGFVTVPTEE